MTPEDWFKSNRAAIEARIQFLRDLPEGLVYQRPGSLHDLAVWKIDSRLELHFHDDKVQGSSKEVISDLDLDRPLHLWAGFTQAMMIGLLWKPEPTRVYVLGFGAGRVPMVLHHHFPQVYIESTDIDPDVPEVARTHFGIQTDERQKVIAEDGRKYLENLGPDERYDIIMVDAFTGLGYSPFLLATREFYQLCTNHLTEGGVVVINLMITDYLIKDKIRTLVECFRDVQCVLVPQDGTIAFFATHAEPQTLDERIAQAESIQAARDFESPFVEHARQLKSVTSIPGFAQFLPQARVLHDDKPIPPPKVIPPPTPVAPARVEIPLPRAHVGRNDPCPCGSGKKYKKCHGQ